MATEKISNKYIQTATKQDGTDTLEASEWNAISAAVATSHTKINGIIDDLSEIPSSGGSASYEDVTEQGGDQKVEVRLDTGITNLFGDTSVGSPFEFTKKTKNNGDYKGTNLTICGNNNINIEPRESVGETKGGNISLKPGDDIELCSHHRTTKNQEEVSVKVINGSDEPTELKINTSEITLTTKDKTGDKPNVLDVNIESAKNTMGYLKVRAQAIDLRCEDHGGIALQPKGYDGDQNMNKIKFEHGGGDGLEFGTFNTEKTSLFTNEYRFKKNGIIKLATRTLLDNTLNAGGNDKYDGEDLTTHYSYQKQADDFYDVIDQNDPTCTWEDIIKLVAYAKTQGWISNPIRISTDAESYTTYVGEDTASIEVVTNPVNATHTFSSSDNSVVSVDNQGYLTGNGIGTATITITCSANGYTQTTKTVTVNVMGARNGNYNLSLSSELSSTSPAWTIPVNSESGYTITCNLLDREANDNTGFIDWSFVPDDVLDHTVDPNATMNESIIITPLKAGTVTITASDSGSDLHQPADVSQVITVTA